MDRLTTYIDGYAHGKQGKSVKTAQNGKHYFRGEFEATGIVEKLALYEDTGLEPEEISELIKKNIKLKK